MTPFKHLTAALTLVAFAGASIPARAEDPNQPPPQTEEPQQEGKFVWGLLLKLVAPVVFDMFADWVKNKLMKTSAAQDLSKMATDTAEAAIVSLNSWLTSRDIVLVSPNAQEGTPVAGLTVDKSGENYQGVNIALVEVDAAGKPKGYRTIKDGFVTGERFKIRVLSTFDGVIVLGNINPTGANKQIYPPQTDKAVSIPAGKEILLPLGKGEYLQFVGDVGKDKLTFTLRDPRSLDSTKVSKAQVFRKDETTGTNFVQEVKPGTYPVIAESIAIEHRAN